MRKILLSILILVSLASVGQNNRILLGLMGNSGSGGGGGSNVSVSGSPDIKQGIGAVVHNLTGVTAGTLLVVTVGSELGGDGGVDFSVTSSPTLTWTKRADATGAGGSCEIYTAVFSAGGSIDITVDALLNAFWQSSVCYKVVNQAASPIGNFVNTTTGVTAPNSSITTTNANSLIFVVSADYDATDVSGGITYRGSPTEDAKNRNSAHGTSVHYRYQATTATSYTVGWTAPTATDPTFNTCVLEIKGN